MKSKTPITKGIALMLCIITISLSWTVYLSYRDSYFIDNFTGESNVSASLAATELENLKTTNENKEVSPMGTKEIQSEKFYQQKKILFYFLLLLLSFIAFSTLQNFVVTLESSSGGVIKNITVAEKEKDNSLKTIFPLITKVGGK